VTGDVVEQQGGHRPAVSETETGKIAVRCHSSVCLRLFFKLVNVRALNSSLCHFSKFSMRQRNASDHTFV